MKGVLSRYDSYGLAAIFGDYEAFAQATQWHQFYALKYQIEAMRRLSRIVGYVITEFTDIYWEGNGLLDFARRPKAYQHTIRHINSEDVILPQPHRAVVWGDEPLRVNRVASAYSGMDWTGATLVTSWGGAFQDDVLPPIAHDPVSLPVQTWHSIPVDEPAIVGLSLNVIAKDRLLLAHNHQRILVLPASSRRTAYTQPVALIDAPASFLSEAYPAELPRLP